MPVRGEALKDDRFKNPTQVMISKKIARQTRCFKKEAELIKEAMTFRNKKKQKKSETYKGPSVISYFLDGRKAMSLPIPVYNALVAVMSALQ